MIGSAPGRLYFWGDRALYLGPDLPAAVHAHHAVQVCIGLSGPVRLGSGPRAKWRSYDGAVIRSNQPHGTDVPAALIASFWLEPDTAEGRRLAPPPEELPILAIERSKLRRILPRLLACWRECWDSKRAAALLDGVVHELAPVGCSSPVIDPRVARARELLASAPDRRLSLAEIAAALALSPSRLAHLFSAELGIPMRRYLLWLRLRDAIEEMAQGASMTEAAHAAGFADLPHLSRTFRRMIGFSPSAMRQVSRFVQDTARTAS